MDITTTLGLAGLAAVGIIAILLAWPRRRLSDRSVGPSRLASRVRSFKMNAPFGDPLLFTGDAPDAGLATAPADCGSASDGGGGGCD